MFARAHLAPWMPLAALVLCAGCGSSDSAVVKGMLQMNGAAYRTPRPEDTIYVTFHNQAQSLQLGMAVDSANATFVSGGPTGSGIPPGDYKITVKVLPYPAGEDRLQRKFSDPKTTPFAYSATKAGGQKILLDLSARSVMIN